MNSAAAAPGHHLGFAGLERKLNDVAREDERSPLAGSEQLRSLLPGDASREDASGDSVSVLWEQIAVEVERLDARPSQQAIANRLGVSRARV